MKILVLSLLRIGDFFQHLRLIDDLRLKYPNHEIDILINEGLPLPESLKDEYKFIFFPRQKIQQALVNSQEHSLKGLQILQKFLGQVKGASYSHVVDLTHTKLSYNIFRILDGQKAWGRQALFHHVLNETVDYPLFKRSLAQTIGEWQGLQVRSRRNRSIPGAPPREVVFQVCTSDPKKDWPISRWKWVGDQLTGANIPWKVICAPFEVSKVASHFPMDRIWSCGFEDLKVPFSSGEYLLVSGDTSILHWASVFEAPSLGLFLGSANVFETFPLTEGARVLSPTTKCWPCRHSENCFQSDFLCHQDIPAQQVLSQILSMLDLQSFGEIQRSGAEANVWQVQKSNQTLAYQLRLMSGGEHEQYLQAARELMEEKLSDLRSAQLDLNLDLERVPARWRRTFAEVLHRVMNSTGRSSADLDKIKEFATSLS